MDNSTELIALRDLREVSLAIRDLENQQTAVAKRYRRGIRLLEKEIALVEQTLDEGGVSIEGTEPWVSRNPSLKSLISNPVIENIIEDTSV
jgi:hypothetical protein